MAEDASFVWRSDLLQKEQIQLLTEIRDLLKQDQERRQQNAK